MIWKIQCFLESPKKLYLPRFYGLKKFGTPTVNEMEEGDNININFKGSLREEQKPIEEIYLKMLRGKRRNHIYKMWWW